MPCQEDNDEDESFERNKRDLQSNATHVYVYGTAEFFMQLNAVEFNDCDMDFYLHFVIHSASSSEQQLSFYSMCSWSASLFFRTKGPTAHAQYTSSVET